jgi:hypothetical protein
MTRKVMSVTVDEALLSEWKKYTGEMCINASKLVEKMLREHLEREGGRKR